jgi:hypothetical protein
MRQIRFLALLTVSLMAVIPCVGQSSNQGSIVGRVTDANAGVVPGVNVRLIHVETNATREATTNESGDFRIDFLPPGKYSLIAERPGFKKAGVTDVVLQVGQVQRVDLSLSVGELSETVTVASNELSTINSESAAIGEVIDNTKIQNLPLNGREFVQLAALVPGAESGNPKRGAVYSYGFSVGFNGARAGYNAYYIDGADSTDSHSNQLISSPALDAIKEFRVETNMYSAQYGRTGGALINVVTNSGTNDFHGSLYEFHRNKWLDAAPVLDQRPYEQRAPYLFNQFGGSIGGPVVLPWFKDGRPTANVLRNKTFFFFSAEGFRQKKPGNVLISFAPTDRERIGDLSQTKNPYTNQPIVLRNPFTGAVIPGNVIPANLISPVGKRLMELWEKPNYSGDPFLNLRLFRAGTSDQNKYLTRIDHNFSSKTTLSGTFNFANYNDTQVSHTVYGDTNNLAYDRTFGLTLTHVFTSTLVNDFKFSKTWYKSGMDFVINDKNYAKDWGLYTESVAMGSPRILLFTQAAVRYDIGNQGPNLRDNQNLYLRDTLVWVRKNHTISMGGDFKRQNYNWLYEATGAGSAYYFGQNDGAPGQDATSRAAGSVFADLLMGVTARFDTGLQHQYNELERNLFGAFIQDDWKVIPRLTLNLGLRYDIEAPFSEANNRFATLDFETGRVVYAKDAPGLDVVRFAYDTGGPNRPYDPSLTNFSPRFGFAFRPFNDNNTAIRGGYGVFYTTETANVTVYGSWIAPFGSLFTYRPKASFLGEATDHFVTVDQKPYRFDDFKGTSPGTTHFIPDYYPTGYMQQWNLTLARELGRKFALEVAYVGTKGTNLNGSTSTDSYGGNLQAKIRTHIPGFSPGIRIKGFNSKYNSFQAKLSKRLSNGLSLLASFTWSHAMAESSNDEVVENILVDAEEAIGNFTERRYANADFDVRKRFVLSGIYELPLGRGRAFGTSWSGVANAVLGGWSLNYIMQLQDGYPFSVYTSNNRFPDRICDGKLPKSERSSDRWIDISCFPVHTPRQVTLPNGTRITVGNHGNSAPNIIIGPGLKSLDLGLHKEFSFTERKKIQFRFEAFNATNHPNFTGPTQSYFVNTVSGAALTRTRDNRDIQVAVKFLF